MTRATLRAIALGVPSDRRDNRAMADVAGPQGRCLLARGGQALPWEDVGPGIDRDADPFCAAMRAVGAGDPFMGGRARYFLGPGETQLAHELRVAREALHAAEITAAEVDLIVYASFPSASYGVSAVADLALALGHTGATVTVEAACAGALAAIEVAGLYLDAGRARHALVIAGTAYSRHVPHDHPIAWTVGDLFSAMVMSADGPGAALLGVRSRSTADTCGAVAWVPSEGRCASPMLLQTAPGGIASLREASRRHLRPVVSSALRASGVDDIGALRVLATNAPLAWYPLFVAQELGVDRRRMVNSHPLVNNCGAGLTAANLALAARALRPGRGDLVGCYAIGSVSSVGAAVFAWGDVSLAVCQGLDLDPSQESLETAAFDAFVARVHEGQTGCAPR